MRRAGRRSLALGTVLALAAAAPQLLPSQGVPSGESDLLGRYREAAERSDDPIHQYNFGTALLRDGRVADAQAPLQVAVRSDRPIVRRHGLYNYGLSSALEGRSAAGEEGTAARAALLSARHAFRQVLRERPDDEDARWNLELIERWLEEEERRSGGQGSAGGQADSPGGAGAGGAPTDGSGEERMLTPEQAAALLDSAGRAEADIRDRVMGRNRFRDPVVERNW
ncbi:MAG: hypothetical protein ACRELC_13645 [Gemmatimonadota bacterium]